MPNGAFDPANAMGMGYFLGPPAPGQRSRWGDDLADARKVFTALMQLLPAGIPPDNGKIPAGYTYLWQFAAHDMVHSTVPLWIAAEGNIHVRNLRTAALQLDTLYGGGPDLCPHAFQAKRGDGVDILRTGKLRLGRFAKPASRGWGDERDIARIAAPPHGAAACPVSNTNDIGAVLAADARNGETTMLAQLVAAFSILHNAIVDKLAHLPPMLRFTHARAATLHAYHAVIRHDLMKRVLHPTVYAQLMSHRDQERWMQVDQGMPYEFTHGVMRAGHAIVRSSYMLQENDPIPLNRILAHGSGMQPLPSGWVMNWKRFFDPTRIDSVFSASLSTRKFIGLNSTPSPESSVANPPPTISVRDWLGYAAARAWNTRALRAQIDPVYPGLWRLDETAIGQWIDGLLAAPLEDSGGHKALVSSRRNELSCDLPLPLYVLLESETEVGNGGQRLGPLGSIIAGEVTFKALAQAASSTRCAMQQAAKELEIVSDSKATSAWGRIDAVRTAPELFELVADWGRLTDADPAFFA